MDDGDPRTQPHDVETLDPDDVMLTGPPEERNFPKESKENTGCPKVISPSTPINVDPTLDDGKD